MSTKEHKKLLLSAGAIACSVMLWCPGGSAFVSETEPELFATGDFDGNGRTDIVIFDRISGKYRLGYQKEDGTFNWIGHRLSGAKDISCIAVGKLLDPKKDALVFTAADLNMLAIADASDPAATPKPQPIELELLGPFGVAAIDIGGAGNNQLDDLVLASIYNDPDPHKIALLRNNDGKTFKVISQSVAKAQLKRANRITLKSGGPVCLAGMMVGDDGASFRIVDLSGGKESLLVEIGDLPAESDYVVMARGGDSLPAIVFYQRGEQNIRVHQLEKSGDKLKAGEAKTFDLEKPIKLLVAVPKAEGAQLLAIFGKGESASVLALEGNEPPKAVQTIEVRSGDALFGAVAIESGFVLFSSPDYMKFSTLEQCYRLTGNNYTPGATEKLASLADNDDWTVPDIHKRIVETLEKEGVASAADMKPYTNAIPGSAVTYVMIPIPGGEFVMGSPENEKGRKPDEGPQHKVKISPFWIGKFEVTWNEYEIFMYPDDEKKLRESYPTDEKVNALSDGVTRPSKPYTEMSFGMGREGFPAISMTQHAANKYCQWLSAKTGHFYRLPTEAEWEYACRAGTTTAYYFGDDASKLSEYGWFEENSEENGDWKYHKVGKKKPNPWGLHDMHGNVWEWCLDQYEDNYEKFADTVHQDPWNKATKPYPHVVRGGSFDDEASRLRSAARRGSDPVWKMRDPQLPKSIWWFTDAKFVGFRIVRPLNVPPPEQLKAYWTSGVERD